MRLVNDRSSPVCRLLPWQIIVPMIVTICAVIFLGLFNSYIVEDILGPAIKEVVLS